MKKKILSMLICLCMLFSMLPMGVMAGDPITPTEYYVGTTAVNDMQEVFEGIADVSEDSGVITIVLTSDISGRIEFNNTDGEYMLDLNGKTINPNGANEALCLGNSFNGTVTVTGSGTLMTGVNNIIYKSHNATLKIAVATGFDYFTLVNGSEDVFDAENTETKTWESTSIYNRGDSLVLIQAISVPVYEFYADASVMYSTYIDKTYVGLLVETNEIPDGATEYGIEIDETKYSATSIFVDGKYVVDIEGISAGTDFAAKPYYTYDGNDYYADEFYFTTASARTTISGFKQSYYANDGDKIAIGYGTEAASNGGAADFVGNNGTSWLRSTYNDAGWSYTFGDNGTWVKTYGPKVAVYNNSTVQAWVVPTTSFDGNFGIITYYIRNISDTTVTDFKFGSAADIMIGTYDNAPITRTDYGISMTGGTDTFALICNEGYADIDEPVTTLWFGEYSYAKSSVYDNTSSNSLTGKDSGAAYSWQGITLEPGEIKEYKIELGIGDAATLESLIKPNAAINYANETISGLTAGSVYIITVGGDEYTITADANGEIAISGTDNNSQDYELFGNDISLAETKEIGGVVQASTPQDISVGSRPNAVIPDYHTPDDAVPELPDDLDITTTDSSITIKTESGQQYSIDGGTSWVTADGDGNVIFTGLDDGTLYNILTRVAATSSSFASEAESFDVKTSKMLTITDVDISGNMQTYDGTAKALTISADGATASYSTTLAGPYSATFPECIDVGTYTVYYKLSKAGYHDYYNIAELEIIKDEVSLPVISNKTYTGSTLKADISENEYYTVLKNDGGKNVGSYDVVLTLKDSNNYKWADGTTTSSNTLQFKITKGDAVITVDTTTINKTYGDIWSLPVATSNFGTVSCNKTVANIKNVGTYTVTYTVAGTSNYNGDTKSLTVIINPKAITKPTEDTTVYTYTGAKQTYNVATSDYYTVSGNKRTDAGSQTVTVALKDKTNCVWADGTTADATFTFAIGKAEPEYTVPQAIANLVYNGDSQPLTTSGITDGGEIQFSTSENGTYTSAIITGKDAKDYEVWYKIIGDSNHTNVEPVKITVSIAKKNIENADVGAFDALTYTGSAQTPVASVTIDGLTATGTWSNVTNVADTTTFTADGNFIGTIANRSAGMSKATPVVTAPVAVNGLVYNATAQTLATAGSTSGGEMQYSLDETTWSADIPTETNANTYTVYYKVLGDANHNDNAGGSVSVTIGKAGKTAPEATGVNETIKSKADGRITGVDNTMEYKKQGDENYIAVTGDAVWNLESGTYLVRYKETENYFASPDKQIVIADGVLIAVTFNSNEGTAVESKTCEYNQTITAPAEPTKEGFEFVSWYLEDTFTTKWTNQYQFTSDTTLYAKWVQGTVSEQEEHVNEVEAEGLNDIAKAEETDIKLVVQVEAATEGNSEQDAIKGIVGAPNNFEFYDITLEKSSGGYVTNASSVIEIKLPYDFTRKTNIKVYRYHSGATEELAQLEARATAPYIDEKCYIDKSINCIYIYSSKFSTYSVAYDTVSSSSGSGTTRYTVKFNTAGGSSVANKTVTRNSTVSEPIAPEKEGYTFMGWFADKALTEAYDFDAKVTKNITLYAKWEKHDDETDEADNTDLHNCPSKAFDDLDVSAWYHPDTDYVIENGIFKGITDKIFEPSSAQTRAMMVTVLWRIENEPVVNYLMTFEDVDAESWYAQAVRWAASEGIVKGYSADEFAPNDNITREQIAAIMHRYAKYKGLDVSIGENTNILSYDDFADISEYAISSMQWACGSELIKGKSESTLNPLDNATRAEIAAIVHRFVEANK